MTRIYVGIDPGLTGAVALLRADGSVEFFDTPTFEIERRKGVKTGIRTEYDIAGMARILTEIRTNAWPPGVDQDPVHVVLEKQQAMPSNEKFGKQGGLQTFSLGYGYGIWCGILGSFGFQHELIRPAEWKRGMMAGCPKEKDASRIKAIQLFPQAGDGLRLKKHHNRAEALLLAEWGRRLRTPTGAF